MSPALSFLVEQARGVSIERVIDGRCIKLRGKVERVGACPICGGDDRFAINTRKQLWNCRGCRQGGRDAISLVRFLDGCDFASSVATLAEDRADNSSSRTTKPHGKSAAAESKAKTIVPKWHRREDDQPWHPIWKDAHYPRGTPVDRHLARRHLILPQGASEYVRFHPNCPFGKGRDGCTIHTPAMVALVRNIGTNAPQAIHRTALDLSGRKVTIGSNDRMALGPTAGGAVKLIPDENVTIAVGIGEGIETALSLARITEWAGSPVWSVLNDNGIANFPVLAGIETLVIAVDHDEAGEKAALAVAERWRAAGREVLLFEALNPNDDLNDVIGDE